MSLPSPLPLLTIHSYIMVKGEPRNICMSVENEPCFSAHITHALSLRDLCHGERWNHSSPLQSLRDVLCFQVFKEKKKFTCIRPHFLETPHWAYMIHNPQHSGEERMKQHKGEGDSEKKQMLAKTIQEPRK